MFGDGLRPPIKLYPIIPPALVSGAEISGNYEGKNVTEKGKTFLLTVVNLLNNAIKMYGNDEAMTWDDSIWKGIDLQKSEQSRSEFIDFVGKDAEHTVDWGDLFRADYDFNGETDTNQTINDAIPLQLYSQADSHAQVDFSAIDQTSLAALSSTDSFWQALWNGNFPQTNAENFNFIIGLLDAKRDWAYGLSAIGIDAFNPNHDGAIADYNSVIDSWKFKESGALNLLVYQNYLVLRQQVAARFNTLSGLVDEVQIKGELSKCLYELNPPAQGLTEEQSIAYGEELMAKVEQYWEACRSMYLDNEGVVKAGFPATLTGFNPGIAMENEAKEVLFNNLNATYKIKSWFVSGLQKAGEYLDVLAGNTNLSSFNYKINHCQADWSQLQGMFGDDNKLVLSGSNEEKQATLDQANALLAQIKNYLQTLPASIESAMTNFGLVNSEMIDLAKEVKELIAQLNLPGGINAGTNLNQFKNALNELSAKLSEIKTVFNDYKENPGDVISQLGDELLALLSTDSLNDDLAAVVKESYVNELKKPVGYVASTQGVNGSFRAFNRMSSARYERQKEDKFQEKIDEARAESRHRARMKELQKKGEQQALQSAQAQRREDNTISQRKHTGRPASKQPAKKGGR
ncbi:hypothetical protein A2311_01520 [candidate division WOR-1 bacterium RIFOXYB2_FULL_48_7]|uniref:Uncharacterized protein n=1 Tax=candidate division WOR-1 bacterium RIFOXYB2_FULL_48_7 TaxID=1802583 RepID=A0A1F4TRP8_UNCSA|nr:MAG: hypothetical protein A2311_01520 [candidate division WOR-1 bacterium RIFOXYB2_FULL_48_7]